MLKKFTVLFVMLSFSSGVMAGKQLSSNLITKVAFHSGGFYIYADGWPNPNECSRTNAVVLKNTDSNYDKAYSLILSAYMASKKVSGYSDGCIEYDGQTYNTIRGFKYLIVE